MVMQSFKQRGIFQRRYANSQRQQICCRVAAGGNTTGRTTTKQKCTEGRATGVTLSQNSWSNSSPNRDVSSGRWPLAYNMTCDS